MFCRDKRLRVIDPRADVADCIAAECDSHGGMKDSKVVWVGQNSDRILTTGFSAVMMLNNPINVWCTNSAAETLLIATCTLGCAILSAFYFHCIVLLS